MKKTYWIQAVTSLHSGIGRGLGYIDNPIARETVTNWPYVPASSIKGVLRDYYNDKSSSDKIIESNLIIAFGTDNKSKKGESKKEERAGALVFTDAKIVCIPIRSIYGTFAWCCSTVSLNRIKRDLQLAGIKSFDNIPNIKEQNISVTSNSELKYEKKVYLEDLDLDVQDQAETETDKIAQFLANKIFTDDIQKEIFQKRFAIVSEEVFNFLCETGTEVIAHNRIKDDTKVTDTGALWYEETLPPETILFGFVWQQEFCKTDLNCFCNSKLSLQLGGKSSVGKGQIICNFVAEEQK